MGLDTWGWKGDTGDGGVMFMTPPWMWRLPVETFDFELWSNCSAVTLGREFDVVQQGWNPCVAQVSLKCLRNALGLLSWKLVSRAAQHIIR
jgi:hypothetical protein